MRRKRGLEKAHSAALSDLQQKPNRENSRKESSISRGLVCLPRPEPGKIPTSRPMSSPDPNPAHISTEILAAPVVRRDREARLWIDGGTARVSFTDREWPTRANPRTRARSVPRVARDVDPRAGGGWHNNSSRHRAPAHPSSRCRRGRAVHRRVDDPGGGVRSSTPRLRETPSSCRSPSSSAPSRRSRGRCCRLYCTRAPSRRWWPSRCSTPRRCSRPRGTSATDCTAGRTSISQGCTSRW